MPAEVKVCCVEIHVPENVDIAMITHITPDTGELECGRMVGGFWTVLVLRGRKIAWLLCREIPAGGGEKDKVDPTESLWPEFDIPGQDHTASMPGPIQEVRPKRN